MQEFVDTSLDITHFAFDTIGSTNDEAFRLAEERGLARFFVTAKAQNSGRGRRGRVWVSEIGNLYASLFLKAPASPVCCAELSFVTAVALHEAISDCTQERSASCALKWPNDVLWNGAKIAGLLLEAREQSGDMDVVVGMGVNCTHHPDDTPYPASNFLSEGIDLTADQLFEALKSRLVQNVNLWNAGRDFETIRTKWLKHARGIGQEITVRLDNEEISGQFRDINNRGQLILGLSDKTERIITAGDVFFPDRTR
ncbi:MAG: biotin--[acetyl-CoA-carboxylase] ligase [Hyphomicrobiales bacterium]